uniref:NADH-ubiquinone oxidoreductase chain 4 n=1 Tax=Syrbatus sp. 2 RRMO-2024a TaxID=3154168 RepID=A0AAU7LKL2_9COLE
MMKFLFMVMFMFMMDSYWLILYIMYMFMFVYMFMYSGMIWVNISYFFGVDQAGFLMILLELMILSLMLLASGKMFMIKDYINEYLKVFIFMMMILLLLFSSMNLFIFFILFEVSLIPMVIMILGWGAQSERLQAGVYLMFYMIMFSMPMMIGIFFCMKKNYTLMFYISVEVTSIYIFFIMMLVFLMKMPIYLIHLWLPKAHVEASISGSMILAGLLLKLGGFGLIRVLINFNYLLMKINYMVISLGLSGSLIVSLICMRQIDLKSLIAYSSIVHMGLVVTSIMIMTNYSVMGAMMMMIAHGLSSSGLFCLVNIFYERLKSRSFFLMKGMMNYMPMMSMWWFLLISSSISCPPSLNLISEIMLMISIISWNSFTFMVLVLIMFLSVVYMLYLYSYSQNGDFYKGSNYFFLVEIREILLLFFHWFYLNIFFLKSDFLLI